MEPRLVLETEDELRDHLARSKAFRGERISALMDQLESNQARAREIENEIARWEQLILFDVGFEMLRHQRKLQKQDEESKFQQEEEMRRASVLREACQKGRGLLTTSAASVKLSAFVVSGGLSIAFLALYVARFQFHVYSEFWQILVMAVGALVGLVLGGIIFVRNFVAYEPLDVQRFSGFDSEKTVQSNNFKSRH